MTQTLTPELLTQLYGQTSNDPFLMLVTISHPSITTIRLVNNMEDIVSNSLTFTAFPMKIRLPTDDGESSREVDIEFDNVSRALIDELRIITTSLNVKIEMVLFSNPNEIQMIVEDLKLRSISYDQSRIRAKLFFDNFLNVEMTSAKYSSTDFPGLF